MVIMVIALNIALATLCLGVAWKLHRFRYSLQRATRWLTQAEQNTELILQSAPNAILLGQFGAQYTRSQITGFGTLQHHFVRIAALLQLLRWISQRPVRPIPKRWKTAKPR
jgi:hypothetical protein